MTLFDNPYFQVAACVAVVVFCIWLADRIIDVDDFKPQRRPKT